MRFSSGGSESASVTTGLVIRDDGYSTVQLTIPMSTEKPAFNVDWCRLVVHIDGVAQTDVSNLFLTLDEGKVTLQRGKNSRLTHHEHRLSFSFNVEQTTSFGCFISGERLFPPIYYGGSWTPRPGYRDGEHLFGLFGSPYLSDVFFSNKGEPILLQ